ncbi:MAG: GntR family transcriptional regulator [Hydrogenophaga sp.]|jgi:DNA-binding GntR family transcriptional regulator|uniref:GntR family transcriptional regulator n=1 Tax=Hydrogenophaga sp. TaxID=1904254 RepID=UPI001DCD3DB0|nr:GntR family transcriptional regulator [Hydrogenophaga sp.]MBW0172359.1 GntR family transcriptional regulator [Hydrogenophaga sp.]MBW0182730.1 GntR family transcriptional regulator [Hydrogenophaga sp.]
MTSQLELERPRLLTDVVAERLREAIVKGDLKLGEQVSEAQLAQRMGVSKTPVREALLRLKSEGLVQIHPQRGTFVFTLSAQELTHLLKFRAMVETEALREAMSTHPAVLLQRMAQCVKEMKSAERARDLPALARIDMNFHWAFFESCDNHYLSASYQLLRHQLTALRHRSPITNAVVSHQVLVDAVEAQDAEKACVLLRGHVLENEPRYLTACGGA